MNSEGTDNRIRHVYGNGGLRKALVLALCIHKGRLEMWVGSLVTNVPVLKTLQTRGFW